MLSKQATHALKALLGLAADPLVWQSTHHLACAQQLPEPMLEQLLLRLRRAGLLTARRGRLGGYRLVRPAREITLAAVLAGLGEAPGTAAARAMTRAKPDGVGIATLCDEPSAVDLVTSALERRLQRAHQKALEELSLEDLLFDLRSAEASRDEQGGLLLG